MTCVVAIKHKNKIYMGADSEISSQHISRVRSTKTPKIFINDKFIIGNCGSLRFNQILQYLFKPSPQLPKESDDEYIYGNTMRAIRNVCFEYGYFKNEAYGNSCEDFILGYKKNIYRVFADFSIEVPFQNFTACGSGENFAMGSLHETEKLHPKIRIFRALACAEKFAPGVKQPFKILELEC